ncbi:POP1-like nucleolar ribonuclease [Plasmodium cynomolgi strain B]|uniref:POP1-like nucleolar ribonuclease n=1 Tax=Plasmodium cynomolgi (strain B) TaxID=1120755 RepID=K6UPD0_PLACD|nr:POP1-like nucleolar ribonuclease [Plasmodium cynomolgi strain B]GAB64434.1 POP1-like nucleolar ribonuclease [Plasmodium cynomolgi strain B]
MQIFQNINRAVKIKHVKNICMYELIGPKSLPLLLNILKIKSKYTVRDEGDLYRFDYESVTLPYDFVIPLYALLPKTIGPFLLNYKVSDCAAQKWADGRSGDGKEGRANDKSANEKIANEKIANEKIANEKGANEKGANEKGPLERGAPNDKAGEPPVQRASPNDNDNDIDLAENAFDYLRTKNGNRTLKASSFSPYDNNILMNERIKQNVIKNIKVNKYEHVRSKKKKKVKTCILKMLRNNKNIQSPTHDENAIQSYIEDFLHKSENEKKNGEQTKKAKGDKEISAIYAELKKNKLTISQNCKKYIKIPILVINQTCNNNQRYFILCPAKKKSSVLFQLLVRNGSIAIGLKEREKILKCSDFICYPKDFPDSHGGILYNSFREQLAKNKYFKKPLRKRINYYCLAINNPFNYSWLCIFPYSTHIKIVRTTDWYNQFLLKTFLHRFLSISLKRLYLLDTMDSFYNFIDEFKAKFSVFSTYFISVYVHAYREGTPERLSHVCSLTVEQLAKFFMIASDQIRINAKGREFPFLALIRNIDSVYYSHGSAQFVPPRVYCVFLSFYVFCHFGKDMDLVIHLAV